MFNSEGYLYCDFVFSYLASARITELIYFVKIKKLHANPFLAQILA